MRASTARRAARVVTASFRPHLVQMNSITLPPYLFMQFRDCFDPGHDCFHPRFPLASSR